MWQPDGAGSRARIGLLVPNVDLVPESEFQAIAPRGVSIHAARVRLGLGRDAATGSALGHAIASAFAEPPEIDNACMMLAAAPLSAIVNAFTSSSYVLGVKADDDLKTRLQASAGTIPVVITSQAACLALRMIAAQRMALIHPPWYSADLVHRGAAYFRSSGFDVIHHGAVPLQSNTFDLEPKAVFDHVLRSVPRSADAVFFGGNGFRSIGLIEALEVELERPVLTANQVAFWNALCLAGVDVVVQHYGRLWQRFE